MTMDQASIIIGITGNICTGKSAVADIISQKGNKVLRYDHFLYQAYQNQDCLNELINCFGKTILDDNHLLDRIKLKMYLKEQPEDAQKLWAITGRYADPEIEKNLQQNAGLSFFECSQLYEKGWDAFCKQVITCYVPDWLRIPRLIKRARERDHFELSEDEARKVIDQQAMSQEEKAARADHLIRNDGDLENLATQADLIYQQIVERLDHESSH